MKCGGEHSTLACETDGPLIETLTNSKVPEVIYWQSRALAAEQERDQLKAELQQAREASARLLISDNFVYCVQYLKNGGERIRAICLVKDATGLSLADSRDFVLTLHTPLPLVDRERPKITCSECRTDFDNDDLRLKSGICPVCRAILERIEKEKK